MIRMRSDSGTGSGRSRTLWTTENSAVLAPIHSASVSAAVIVNALSFHSSRRPTRISEFIRGGRREKEQRSSECPRIAFDVVPDVDEILFRPNDVVRESALPYAA